MFHTTNCTTTSSAHYHLRTKSHIKKFEDIKHAHSNLINMTEKHGK